LDSYYSEENVLNGGLFSNEIFFLQKLDCEYKMYQVNFEIEVNINIRQRGN